VTPEAFAAAIGENDGVGANVLGLSAKPDPEAVRLPIALDPMFAKQRFMSAIGAPLYVPAMFGGGQLEHDCGAAEIAQFPYVFHFWS
jgi:hypothetical protein